MKLLYKYLLTLSVTFLYFAAGAQQKEFIHAGKIVYEKRVNALLLLKQYMQGDDDDGGNTFSNQLVDLYQKNYKPFQVVNFDLDFTARKSLFYKSKEANPLEQALPSYVMLPAQENTVYNNFSDGQAISEKAVAGGNYLLTDSLRKINWKITDETREIAGFQCRRANALIMDSIYVVAFYSPQIIAPAGPESFTGLPGAILGLALPYEHVTWFATHVYTTVDPDKIIPPTKGKKMTGLEFYSKMRETAKNWGKWGNRILKYCML